MLQLLPLSAFARHDLIPMSALRKFAQRLGAFGSSYWNHHTNVEGAVYYYSNRTEPNRVFTQFYRTGCIESVIVYERDSDPTVRAAWQERATIDAVNAYTRSLLSVEVPPPYAVFVSLLNARGFRLYTSRLLLNGGSVLDRDSLLLPEVTVEEPGASAGAVLRPLYDMFWHAFNCPEGTPNLNDFGEWTGESL